MEASLFSHFLNEGLLIASSQGVLLCVVLWSLPSGNRIANQFLASYVGLESLHLFYLHLVFISEDMAPNTWLRLAFGLRYLDGPALLLYAQALTIPDFRLKNKHLVHAGVLVLWLIWATLMFFRPGWAELSANELQLLPSTIAASSIHSAIVIAYAAISLNVLKHHNARVKQALSGVDKISLDWLKWLLVSMIVIGVLHILCDILRLLGVTSGDTKAMMNLTFTASLIYLISLGGIRQPQIFTTRIRAALEGLPSNNTSVKTNQNNTKYQRSGLSETHRKQYWETLRKLIDSESPYLDPTLDLSKLAKMMSVKPQELSETINSEYGGSFYDLINKHRIDAAKSILEDEQQSGRKLLDIALSVGFTSQSTFYNRFKRETGMTPSKYKEQQIGE